MKRKGVDLRVRLFDLNMLHCNRTEECRSSEPRSSVITKGQVYDWGWFQNTGSHTRTKIIHGGGGGGGWGPERI